MSARTPAYLFLIVTLGAAAFGLWSGASYNEPPAPTKMPLPIELAAPPPLEDFIFAPASQAPDWATVQPFSVPDLVYTASVPKPELVAPQGAAVAKPAPRHYAKVETLDIAALELESFSQLSWATGETLHGAPVSTPVLVAKGKVPGKTLCVTAAVHGDELNGIEAVRNLMYSVNVSKLTGTIIGVPIVNLQGFQRGSRYLTDRRDLNRYFPGHPRGSVAARMAYGFFENVIRQCDGLVDLHTGSFHRTNLPQLRADLHNEDVLELTQGFGSTTVLHSSGGEGTLRRAAVEAGIPAVTLEAGEPLRLQEEAVDHTIKALFTLLDQLGMYNKRSLWGNPQPTYYQSAWVRADQGGMLFSKIKLGKRVAEGDILGSVTDPITNEQVTITAPYSGRVIGMAVNQFVMPGYATYHLAAETDLDNPQEAPLEHGSDLDIAASSFEGSLEESE